MIKKLLKINILELFECRQGDLYMTLLIGTSFTSLTRNDYHDCFFKKNICMHFR